MTNVRSTLGLRREFHCLSPRHTHGYLVSIERGQMLSKIQTHKWLHFPAFSDRREVSPTVWTWWIRSRRGQVFLLFFSSHNRSKPKRKTLKSFPAQRNGKRERGIYKINNEETSSWGFSFIPFFRCLSSCVWCLLIHKIIKAKGARRICYLHPVLSHPSIFLAYLSEKKNGKRNFHPEDRKKNNKRCANSSCALFVVRGREKYDDVQKRRKNFRVLIDFPMKLRLQESLVKFAGDGKVLQSGVRWNVSIPTTKE